MTPRTRAASWTFLCGDFTGLSTALDERATHSAVIMGSCGEEELESYSTVQSQGLLVGARAGHGDIEDFRHGVLASGGAWLHAAVRHEDNMIYCLVALLKTAAAWDELTFIQRDVAADVVVARLAPACAGRSAVESSQAAANVGLFPVAFGTGTLVCLDQPVRMKNTDMWREVCHWCTLQPKGSGSQLWG